MDAIRKKMHSLKIETDQMTSQIGCFEAATKESNTNADKHDADIRDLQKKISNIDAKFEETHESLVKSLATEEEREKEWKTAEEDVNNLNRRMLLCEEENKRRESDMASAVMDLCLMSKSADSILRRVKVLQSKNMTNEVLLEELDKEVKEAKFMCEDADKKYVEISRRLEVMEMELKKTLERAALAEDMNINLEDQLRAVGENMKQLEVSEEKAMEREERFKEKIRSIMLRLKEADKRAEYGEMNITKLNLRIDDIEDEIVREKLKIKHVSDELSDTFDDMLTRY
jgi:tropomyosin-1